MEKSLLRVASYNVEWFFTKAPFPELELADVPMKSARLCDVISGLGDLDLLALQEVQSENELAVLCAHLRARGSELTPICGRFASARTGQRVAWLYNDRTITLLEHGTYDFQDFQLLEKNLWLDVEWKAAKTPVRVVALHMKANFDVSSTELREREAKALAQELGKVQGPLIVTGDFNDFDLEIDANALLRSTVLSTVRKSCGGLATAGELQPLRTTTVYGVMIDHVLVNKHLQFESCIVHKSADLQETPVKDRTSDHYPISCSIALKK